MLLQGQGEPRCHTQWSTDAFMWPLGIFGILELRLEKGQVWTLKGLIEPQKNKETCSE